MKSPFPGMDPYLEARWSDVHVKLVAYVGEAVQPLLPTGLRARSEERILLETIEQQELASYRSDVAVIESGKRRAAAPMSGGAVMFDPVLVEFYDAPEADRFVQIIDTSAGNRVVTAIEVLSPWNKGPGLLNKRYRKKLADYRRAEVNVVEIDLLREPGRGRLDVGQEDLPPARRAPYLTCIWRAEHPSRWEIYPMSLRQRLPKIPIPLRETDADVTLDLQPLIERVYVAGGHDDIDYARPCDPPLPPEDAAWFQEMRRNVKG